MMADTGFLKGLVEFDKDSLSEKQVQLVAQNQILHKMPKFHVLLSCSMHDSAAIMNSIPSMKCSPASALVQPAGHCIITPLTDIMCYFAQACGTLCAKVANAVRVGQEGAGVHERSQIHCG